MNKEKSKSKLKKLLLIFLIVVGTFLNLALVSIAGSRVIEVITEIQNSGSVCLSGKDCVFSFIDLQSKKVTIHDHVEVIGKSVEGRDITAYYFGNGDKTIIFYAAMHGYEGNSTTLMYEWIAELEKHPQKIPDDKTIIVIPAGNPDGLVAPIRFNSNGVDLNRNFDTANWQSTTYFHDDTILNGGGKHPFSEPETRAIRDLVLKEKPFMVLSYHSAVNVVIPSNRSDAIVYAKKYSEMSGYNYASPTQTGVFEYSVTGTFENWATDNNIDLVLVEMATPDESEREQNLPAMWRMLEY